MEGRPRNFCGSMPVAPCGELPEKSKYLYRRSQWDVENGTAAPAVCPKNHRPRSWTLNPELLNFPLCVCMCVGDSRSTVLHFWKNELLALKLNCVTFLSHQVFSFFWLWKIGVYIMLKCKWSAWGLLFPPSSLSFCLLLCKKEKYIFIPEHCFQVSAVSLFPHNPRRPSGSGVVVVESLKATVRAASQNTQPIKHIYCQLCYEPFRSVPH